MNGFRRTPFWTYLLIGLNVWFGLLLAHYAWDTHVLLTWGAMSAKMPKVQSLAQLPPFVSLTPKTMMKLPVWLHQPLRGNELLIVRAIWASFLHFSWAHLLSNMFVLLILGQLFERANYGSLIVPIYLVTGAISMTAAYELQPEALTAGASGALFGLIGVSCLMSVRAKWAFRRSRMSTYAINQYDRLGNAAMSLFVVNIVSTFLTPGISIVGHVAGFISGLLLGLFVPLRRH